MHADGQYLVDQLDGAEAKLSNELFDGLKDTHVDIFSRDWDDGEGISVKPELRTPTVVELIELARPGARIDPNHFVVMLESMQCAATRRTEGVLVKQTPSPLRPRRHAHCLLPRARVDRGPEKALEQLDDRPRTALVDALIARAAKGNSGWKPSSPGNEIVREVETFTAAVRRIGYAAPEQIDDYLRQGMKAFLGGDYATARAIYQALLPPIAEAEIDLGQHDLRR